MKKQESKLALRKKKKDEKKRLLKLLKAKQLKDVWFNARVGVHLVRKGSVIVPDKGYLKSLEYPFKIFFDEKHDMREAISDLDARIKHERSIQYHGPVAGQKAGALLECSGSEWLVTESPPYIEPIAGNWPHLKDLIESLLPNPIAQAALFSWCQTQYIAVRDGRHSQCPMLIFAGGAGDGKTLLLNLITAIRGGREINPIKAWSGEGPVWNDHLLGCECLNIDDSVALKNYQARQNLATSIKEAIFANSVTIDKRNNTSFTLQPRPVWGVAMAVNANSDSIKTVPALDGADMADKATVLRTHRAKILFREQGDEAAEKRYKAYKDELPAFVNWLLREFKKPKDLPEGCFAGRSGTLVYRDPEALTELHRVTPAGLLEEVLLDFYGKTVIHKHSATGGLGTIEEPIDTATLLGFLREEYEKDRRVPDAVQTAGKYLTQIAARPNSCIEEAGENRNHSKLWVFKAPD